MLYKNLSRKDKKLYKLCYECGLTEWHYAAARILERVNGMENAEGYLRKVKEAKDIREGYADRVSKG